MIGLFKKVIVDFPVKMKGNSKRTSGYSLSPLSAPEQGYRRCSSDVLAGVELRKRHMLKSSRKSLSSV